MEIVGLKLNETAKIENKDEQNKSLRIHLLPQKQDEK